MLTVFALAAAELLHEIELSKARVQALVLTAWVCYLPGVISGARAPPESPLSARVFWL